MSNSSRPEHPITPGLREAINGYTKLFNIRPHIGAETPGRVEVIGNFTDLLPSGQAIGMPIDLGFKIAVGYDPNSDLINIFSTAYPDEGVISISPRELDERSEISYVNFILACYVHAQKLGAKPIPLNFYIDSNLPTIGGLSSSAALEMGIVLPLLLANEIELEKIDARAIAQVCKEAENDPKWVGSSCGYLDQASSISTQSALLTFAPDGEYAYRSEIIDLSVIEDAGLTFVVGVGGKSRELAKTGYGHKAKISKDLFDYLTSLEQVGSNLLGYLISNESILVEQFNTETVNALKHLLMENKRVSEFHNLCRSKEIDIQKIANLLNESGDSSLTLWGCADAVDGVCQEVPELGYLVGLAREQDGVLASRTHGGGWNTTFLFLAETEKLEKITDSIRSSYLDKFGNNIDFLKVRQGHGARAFLL